MSAVYNLQASLNEIEQVESLIYYSQSDDLVRLLGAINNLKVQLREQLTVEYLKCDTVHTK